jgi:hypothetical protein
MAKYMEYIIDPEMPIRAYLHQRWLCKLFVVLNCIIELLLLAFYLYKNHGMINLEEITDKVWSKSET